MERLNKVKPESEVIVKRIDGEQKMSKHLEELGVKEGVELRVLATEVQHEHVGPICLKTVVGEVILSQGMADKVYVKKEGEMTPLLQLEKGSKGVVKNIEAGKDFRAWLDELGIKEGTEVEFLRHVADDTLVFKADGEEIKIGEGEASKILVEAAGKKFQANYIEEGNEAIIVKFIGGIEYRHKLKKLELEQGMKITLFRKEEHPPAHVRGQYIKAKIGENVITIGHGMAEKIWV